MFRKIQSLFILFLILSFSSFSKHKGDYLNNITTKYITPHYTWAKPLYGGKIKCLFIVVRQGAREVVEVWERMDIDFESFIVFHSGLLTLEDMYEGQVEGTTFFEKKNEIISKLNKDYDVIIFGNVKFDILPAEAKYKIIEKVKNGTGLIFFYNHGTIYKNIFKTEENCNWLSKGIDLESIPFTPTGWTPQNLLTSDKKFKIEELFKGYKFGNGRILIVNYPGVHSTYWGGVSLTNLESYSPFWKADYENYMALISRAILWAAKREKDFNLIPINFKNGDYIKQEKFPFDLKFRVETEKGSKIFFRVRDIWNEIVYTKEINMDEPEINLNMPFLKGGKYFIDYIIKTKNEVKDFGFFSFNIDPYIGNVILSTDKESYNKGEKIKISLNIENDLKGKGEIFIKIVDSLYRKTYIQKNFPISSGNKNFNFDIYVDDFPTIGAYLQCYIIENGNILVKTEKEIFFPKREKETFPVILWGGIKEELAEIYIPQILKAGFTSSLNHPSKEGLNAKIAALFNLKFVPYMYRIMLNSDENGWTQEGWLRTSDTKNKEKYGGDGSFYNPVVQEEAKKVIVERIKNLPLYGPLVYSLGDENYFSYDGGFSPSEEEEFKIFLEEKYKKIENLNKEWGEKFNSFEEVKHYKLKEAVEKRKYAAWYDHRCFMEKEYAEYHHYLSKIIKEIDPYAKVGAEGSVPGNLEYTISKLEFWGPYADKIQNELLRSIGWDKLRTNWWGGYVGSHGGRDEYPYPLWQPLLCGIVNGNSWFAAGPGSEGFISVDFSYAEYFEKMLPRLKKLYDGIAQLLVENKLKNDKIAIHWSHPSYSISLLGEPFISPKNSTSQFIDFSYRNGINFEFLTTDMIEKGKLKDYKIFFLFGSSSINDKEKEEIENFVKNGGVLVSDMNPGILNGYCRPLGESQIKNVIGSDIKGEEKFIFKPVNIDCEIRGKRILFNVEKVLTSPEEDLFKVNYLGKGISIFLNFELNSAFNTSSLKAFDKFLLDILEISGIKKEIELEGLNKERTIIRMRENPEFKIVGILTTRDDIGKRMKLIFDEKYYIYRSDDSFIKYADSIEEKVIEPFMIYSLFKEKQEEPKVKIENENIKRGEKIKLSLLNKKGERIYRIRIYNKDEEIYKNVLKFENIIEIPISYDEKRGNYTCEITDIATGLKCKINFNLI